MTAQEAYRISTQSSEDENYMRERTINILINRIRVEALNSNTIVTDTLGLPPVPSSDVVNYFIGLGYIVTTSDSYITLSWNQNG